MLVQFENIPFYNADTDVWSTVDFNNQDEFASYLESIFKQPGEYNFDASTQGWNAEARKFEEKGAYCFSPYMSNDFKNYWNQQKERCRKGVLWKSGNNEWYLDRAYYMLLNFLPIINKEKGNIESFLSIRDVQYHISLYEKIAECRNKHSIITKKRQCAEQPHSELIYGKNGWVKMGDIRVGDEIWNPDGTLQTVIDKSSHKNAEVYEFEFLDGRKCRAGIEHNWQLYDAVLKKEVVLNTKDLLNRNIFTPVNDKYVGYRYSIPYILPCNKPTTLLPIDPYIIGCLLGDGSMMGNSVDITTYDDYIKETFESILKNTHVLTHSRKPRGSKFYRFTLKSIDRSSNPLIKELKKIGLYNKNCYNKFIPTIYKESSVEQKVRLLTGLMDADGYVNSKGNNIHYTTTSKVLSEDVCYLVRSLGLKCSVSIKTPKDINHKEFYRINISGNILFDIFSLPKKLNRFRLRKTKHLKNTLSLTSIKKLDYLEDSSCIMVDNPNHLYITSNFIVTHNSSYWHTAKMINIYWFEKKAILRNLASDENYLIGDTGIWNYYNGYRDFLNEFTAWNRPNTPNKDLSWVQRIEVNNNGVKSFKGRKSVMTGVSLKKSATGGVGGPSYYTYHEEAGIAPKLDKTYIFTKPALSSGLGMTTGMFIAAGSVGDLKDCQPLKKYMYSPEENGFLGVPNHFAKKDGTIEITGLYIPEQWGLPGFIDEFGNSKVSEALDYLNDTYAKMEAEMDPEDFQLELSQRPRFMDEAFAFRTVSKFPLRKIEKRQDLLKNSSEKKYRKAWLSEDDNGRVKVEFVDKEEVRYPVDAKAKDKEGVVLIHKMPETTPAMFTYYAGVDNIEVEETTTSKSLYSIYIVEGSTQVKYWDKEGVEKIREEGDTIVASWTGRLNSVEDTNKVGELLIRLYNAFTLCERNKPNFITHMIKQGYRHLLATANDVPIWKEASDIVDPTKNLEIGIYMDSTGKKQAIADDYLIQWLKEERDAIYKTDSQGIMTNEKVKTITTLDGIDDFWLLEELKNEKDNTDRRDALRLAIMLKTIQQAKGRRVARVDSENRPENNKPNKLIRTINFLGENNKLNYTNRKINLLG
jgi:hypothetical protein